MQVKIKKIREIDIIEKELDSIASGVMVLRLTESHEQFATNFVYHDKNIYFFIQDKELYNDIRFESSIKFTAIKESSSRKKDKEVIYRLFYISVKGIVKKVEEQKITDIIKQKFVQKYSGQSIEAEDVSKSFPELLFIDTEELIATEETGS